MDATERAPLMGPGPLSDGQFYSPPESVAGLSTRTDPETSKISHAYLDLFSSIHKFSLMRESLAVDQVQTIEFKETKTNLKDLLTYMYSLNSSRMKSCR